MYLLLVEIGKQMNLLLTFSRIFEILTSQLLLHEITQNFVGKVLTIRNNIDKICVLRAVEIAAMHFFLQSL